MKIKIQCTILLVIALFQINCLFAQANDTLKVLFIGNSYTYYHNLAQNVREMAATQGLHWITKKSTAGGADLKDHWIGEKNLKTKEILGQEKWDYVVLQNYSTSGIDRYDEFIEYGKKWIDLINIKGAKPLLYVTWAREYNPLMQREISNAYSELAQLTGVKLVPVGNIWEKARMHRPDLNLFHPDQTHPSPVGTYLTACVFYSVISGNKVATLPETITSKDQNGEEIFYSMMTKENAYFLKQVVDEYLYPTEMKK